MARITKSTAVVILTIIGIALTSTTFASLSTNRSFNSAGGINVSAGLGVYSDSSCSTNLTTINWGNIAVGGNISQTIYVKNIGSGTSLALNMSTSNWNPTTARGNMTISWNQEGTRLLPGQSIPAIITLKVSPTIIDITNFNVQITIAGTQ